MYLLYLDESGNEDDPKDRYFVLAGAAVFERTTYFVSRDLDNIQAKYFPGLPPIEFHASPIRKGKDFWRGVTREKRLAVLEDISRCIATSNTQGVALFACAIEKNASLYGEKAVELATEQVLKRFDTYLVRHAHAGNPQRGLVIFSEGRFDKRAKVWVRKFRELGTRWGAINNLSDIPYFASVRDTRLLQLADFVAHSVFLLYEKRDPSLISRLLQRFDQKEGIIHGLFHHCANKGPLCGCPACVSRAKPGSIGDWVQPISSVSKASEASHET